MRRGNKPVCYLKGAVCCGIIHDTTFFLQISVGRFVGHSAREFVCMRWFLLTAVFVVVCSLHYTCLFLNIHRSRFANLWKISRAILSSLSLYTNFFFVRHFYQKNHGQIEYVRDGDV